MKRYLKIGNRRIGDGEKVFIIAEIGVNHNGNLALAKKMIDAAKKCGADAVKFQSFRTEDIITEKAPSAKIPCKGDRRQGIVVRSFEKA